MANKLLSLELHGYKTFASKTFFNFPGQITAVVGPNGSGKSNIADAVRWVLGEQAYSLLRGKKTIDMIFSGSEQRPRASMASVSITLDNQSGWLPVEFTEVKITRRAYRSGENEYLLNNQRVRLKEINELLANSGLGERTYTIIGQGLVDTALSLKPEERRRFFEEASGIGLYRARREEATQKLDKTLHNMERANDILRELKPRMGYLEKSKEKAKQYLQLQDDLNVLLKDWYGFHWHSVQREIKYALDFHSKQKEQLYQRREAKQQLEMRLNSVQTGLKQKRAELANQHMELSRYHASKEDATRELAVLEERARSNQERLQELENAKLVSADELEQVKAELAGLEHSGGTTDAELVQANAVLVEVSAQLAQRQAERQAIEAEIAASQRQIVAFESEILKTEARINQFQHQSENERNELSILESNQGILKKAVLASEGKIKLLETEAEQLQIEINKNMQAHEQNLEQRTKLRERINLLEMQQKEADVAISKQQAQLKVIEQAEQSLAGFTTGSKEFVQAARESKIHGKWALLLDHLKVPEQYELAISAALGEMLEGIILDEGSSTSEILEYLEQSKASRVTLMPKWWAVHSPQPSVGSPGGIWADELIKADGEYANLVKKVLATILIVDDAKNAEGVIAQLPIGFKAVTRKGEVFDTRGTITAGSEFRVKNLSRKREKESLAKEIEELVTSVARVALELEQARKSFQEVEEKHRSLRQTEQDLREKRQQLEIEQHKLKIEGEQKSGQMKDLLTRLQLIQQAMSTRTGETMELEAQLEGRRQKLTEKQAGLQELFSKMNALPIEEIRTQVMALSSEKAVVEEMANQHLSRLAEKNKTLEEVRARLQNQQERLQSMTSDMQALKQEITQLTGTDVEVSQQIKALNTKIKPLEEEVETGIKQQGSFLEEVDASRNQFSIAERHALQSQMKVDRLKDRLDDLRKKIQEDFGLLPEETEGGMGTPRPLPLEGMIAALPEVELLPENLDDQIKQQRSSLRRIGPINPDAQREYDEVFERVNFLSEQLADLGKAEKDLRQVVNELDGMMKKEFLKTFRKVEEEFHNIFGQLFSGGSARLFIEDEDNIMDSGIVIEATLPGKRRQELALLSGGERSLTAVALIFALLKISPTPFCILDEVDAMLDESNVVRFGELLRELSETTQFIVITHNRNTVQLADVLYGVTMGKDTVSQVISLRMDELTDEMVQ